METTVAVENV